MDSSTSLSNPSFGDFNSCTTCFTDRVLYARKGGEDIAGSKIEDGEKISLDIASVSHSFFVKHANKKLSSKDMQLFILGKKQHYQGFITFIHVTLQRCRLQQMVTVKL